MVPRDKAAQKVSSKKCHLSHLYYPVPFAPSTYKFGQWRKEFILTKRKSYKRMKTNLSFSCFNLCLLSLIFLLSTPRPLFKNYLLPPWTLKNCEDLKNNSQRTGSESCRHGIAPIILSKRHEKPDQFLSGSNQKFSAGTNKKNCNWDQTAVIYLSVLLA